MNSIFRTASIAAVLTLTTNSQALLCGDDKTIHIQLPAGWTTVYSYAVGSFTPQVLTAEGNGWYSFPLRGGSASFDYGKFLLPKANADYYAPTIGKLTFATNQLYDISASDVESISCSEFGTATDLYLLENPANPGFTYLSAVPPGANDLHFLPPTDAAWVDAMPVLVVGDSTYQLKPDVEHCGWFTHTFFNTTVPANAILFPKAGASANGIPVDLAARYSALGTTSLYASYPGSSLAFSATDPGTQGTCSFAMAALFYDTDASLHGAFSCDSYPSTNSACQYPGVTWGGNGATPCVGVTKGIVQANLGANRKPQFVDGNACFENAGKFDQLFNSTQGVNTVSCHDIALDRTKTGEWLFDSYATPDQGFFPLEDQPNSGTGTKRDAYGSIQLGAGTSTDGVSNWGLTDPATGLRYFDSYPTQEGDFSSGTSPNVYNDAAWDACPNLSYPGQCRMHPTDGRNQHFCLESHSEFTYQPGQRIVSSGNDDIWVFIDGKLAVDLGGMHLPAPAIVQFDTLGLTAGQSYTFDYFQCQRRTNMSNLRLQTNFRLGTPQSEALDYTTTVDSDGNQTYTFQKVTTGGGCQALLGEGPTITVGADLLLTYTLTNLATGSDASPNTSSVLDFSVPGAVTLLADSVAFLAAGDYALTAKSGNVSAVLRFSIDANGKATPVLRTRLPSLQVAGNGKFAMVREGRVAVPAALQGKPCEIRSTDGRLLASARNAPQAMAVPFEQGMVLVIGR